MCAQMFVLLVCYCVCNVTFTAAKNGGRECMHVVESDKHLPSIQQALKQISIYAQPHRQQLFVLKIQFLSLDTHFLPLLLCHLHMLNC